MINYIWSEDFEETGRLAMEAADRAIELDPKLPDAYKAKANAHMDDSPAAMAALEKAIEIDPKFNPAIINLGANRALLYDLAGAERCFRRVIENDPQDVFAMTWLSEILRVTFRASECILLCRRARELASSGFYYLFAYGGDILAQIDQGEYEEAERVLVLARAEPTIDPQELVCLRVLLHAIQGRTEEARTLLKENLDHRWVTPFGTMAMAWTAFLVGQPEDAAFIIKHATIGRHMKFYFRMADAHCHALLDQEGWGGRKTDQTLVWPLQAPMVDEARWALFGEVKVESGRP